MIVSFLLELHFFGHIESSQLFCDSEHSYMFLFGQFPFWVPTSFPEAIYPTCNPHVPVIKEQIKTAKKT